MIPDDGHHKLVFYTERDPRRNFGRKKKQAEWLAIIVRFGRLIHFWIGCLIALRQPSLPGCRPRCCAVP